MSTGEVSKVNVTLAQEKSYDGDKQYRIECSTNSGCQQSSLDFVTEVSLLVIHEYSVLIGYSKTSVTRTPMERLP